MEYTLYRLAFRSAVHFGRENLDEGESTCCADTIFSALCLEALKRGEAAFAELYRGAKEGNILLSDAFPYMGDTCFLPKPIKRVAAGKYYENPVTKKAFKKIKYIPAECFGAYLRGEYRVSEAPDFESFGRYERKKASSLRGEQNIRPYSIGSYNYGPGNGIYILVGCRERRNLDLVEGLLEALSFSGLGGKRAAGFGRFSLSRGEVPQELGRRLGRTGESYMSLSVSLPTDGELEKAMEGAEYLLCKRGGFVCSENYAEEQRRKRDLYVLKAGSCFGVRFCGDIYDVSDGGGHPVYRYAKPMLMEAGAGDD